MSELRERTKEREREREQIVVPIFATAVLTASP